MDGRVAQGRVNLATLESNGQVVIAGELIDGATGTFNLGETTDGIGGTILPSQGQFAYQVATGTDGAAYLLEKTKDRVLCMDNRLTVTTRAALREAGLGSGGSPVTVSKQAVAAAYGEPSSSEGVSTAQIAAVAASAYTLSSRPNAPAVAYLDFDGETVIDPSWYGGNTINASASGFSAAQIIEVWRRVSEDFLPFNIDITTDRSRYDNASANSRTRCIITPDFLWFTTTSSEYRPEWYHIAPAGVAVIGSWGVAGSNGLSATVPCWVFPPGVSGDIRKVAEAASHEIGHTFSLIHDGLNDSGGNVSQAYFQGHGSGATSWAPIMGAVYFRNVGQWSRGDYAIGTTGLVANNTQDDLALINNHLSYMPDDAGNTPAGAVPLRFSGSAVATVGTIERTSDVDMYSFTTAGGAASFSLVPESPGYAIPLANLDAQATLYDATGVVVAHSNPVGSLYPSFTVNLGPGTYYLAIMGVGEGSPTAGGYSAYGSLGRYEITGSVPTVAVYAPTITSTSSARAVLGKPFAYQIVATNSPTYYAASGLPNGLAIDAGSGLISGTPSVSLTPGVLSITLSASNPGGTGSQTLSLDLVSAFSEWGQANSIDVNNDPQGDPDGDGLSNLLEYAFAQSPHAPQNVAVASVTKVYDNGTPRLEFTFTRPNDRPDIVYTVEVSSDLRSWTSGHAYGVNVSNGGGLPTQEVERTSLGAAGERIRVRDVGGSGVRFIRVKVTTR